MVFINCPTREDLGGTSKTNKGQAELCLYICKLLCTPASSPTIPQQQGVLDLVKTLGPQNVFVSVYESGSWDDSKGALRELDRQLEKMGVGRKIVLNKETHAGLIAGPPGGEGWVTVPGSGKKGFRRIPYLSRLRNLSLQPLREMAANGTTFDHVLFLGDVVFSVPDILTLLTTNAGQYAAACSLDSLAPSFYDTFALRDIHGHEYASQTFPLLPRLPSRRAMLRGGPVPVASCWNGIVAMPPPFVHPSRPLLFRGVPDSLAAKHVEGSECCLVHADNLLSGSWAGYG
ncbi:hypothetical protein N0V88_006927 [Collariella sp. IMI 366227]|nr:hypothetical protein N0V88_006927 [Collariella sp. IMI 366227]